MEGIEKQALEYTNKMDSRFHDPMELSCAEAGFIHGAEWMLEQYQGITPETVKEMLGALKSADEALLEYECYHAKVKGAINKAGQELNQG